MRGPSSPNQRRQVGCQKAILPKTKPQFHPQKIAPSPSASPSESSDAVMRGCGIDRVSWQQLLLAPRDGFHCLHWEEGLPSGGLQALLGRPVPRLTSPVRIKSWQEDTISYQNTRYKKVPIYRQRYGEWVKFKIILTGGEGANLRTVNGRLLPTSKWDNCK